MKKNLVKLLENSKIPDQEKIGAICVDAGLIPVASTEKNYETKNLLDLLGLYNTRDNGSLLYSRDRQKLNDMIKATKNKDEYKIGLLYGFPECCINYYNELKRKDKAPLIESFKAIRKRLKDNKPTPAYFREYVPCPNCLSTKDSPSGYAEKQMADVLKENSPKLHEAFNRIRNSKWIYFPSADNIAVLQFEGSDRKLKRNLMYVG